MFKVKCIGNGGYRTSLTVGNVYEVLDTSDGKYKILDNDTDKWWYEKERFTIIEDDNQKEQGAMKEFLNEDMKQFKDLSDEEMLAVIKAKMKGECDIYYANSNEWISGAHDSLVFNHVYRTKPQIKKQLVIPWEMLPDDVQYVAMDKDGELFGYATEPRCSGDCWTNIGNCFRLKLKIDTSGIDWKDSLVKRPEGV